MIYRTVRHGEESSEDEVGGAWGERSLRTHLCVDRVIILKWILTKEGWEGVGWIHLTRDLDKLRAVVNMVMNLRVRGVAW